MKQAFKVLSFMTFVYLAAQFVFNVMLSEYNKDLTASLFVVLTTLVFVFLYSRGLVWAQWMLSFLLVLTGVMCMVTGFIIGPLGTVIGLYHVFFGVYIHKGKMLLPLSMQSQPLPMMKEEDGKGYLHFDEEHALYHFPSLVQRYIAMFIDYVLMMAALIAVIVLVDGLIFSTEIVIFVALIMLLTYEPLLTAFSGTLGQRVMHIKVVRNDDPYTRISVLNAYKRCFTKAVLGWISFFTITYNPRHRAMHDIASDSVVVNG